MRLGEADTAFRQRTIDCYSGRQGVEAKRDVVAEYYVQNGNLRDDGGRVTGDVTTEPQPIDIDECDIDTTWSTERRRLPAGRLLECAGQGLTNLRRRVWWREG